MVIKTPDHIKEIAAGYKLWLCDIWGVLHNGAEASQKAAQTCRQFRAEGGRVILITNAPRPNYSVEAQFDQFGVAKDMYDGIVSSGDVTVSLVQKFKNQPIFHLGPARDKPILERAEITPFALENAQVVLCSGLYDDDTETPEDYRDMLMQMKAKQMPMICANPDLKVERGDRLVYCGGAIAALYEQLGGQVHYAGKPFTPIYDLALERAAPFFDVQPKQEEILCIGDGLFTDIKGAMDHGYDCVYIASTLHADHGQLTKADYLNGLFKDFSKTPVAVQKEFIW